MKRKQRGWALPVTILFVMVLVALAVMYSDDAEGATVNRNMKLGNPATDSVYVVRRDASAATLIDSTLFDTAGGAGFASFPYDTSYTWDEAIDYDVWIGYYYPGDGWFPFNDPGFFKLTGAAAAIDYDSIQTLFVAGAAGTGAYSVTLLTWDSTTGLAVPTVSLTIRPVDQSTHVAGITTASNGHGTANLDADSFAVIEGEAGWTQDNTTDTIVVTAATDTFIIYMDQYDPAAPAGANTCAIYGHIGSVVGMIADRLVCFELKTAVPDTCDDVLIVGLSGCDRTNSDGRFDITLRQSHCLISGTDSVEYEITIEGSDITETVKIPNASSYQVVWD